MLTGAVDQLPGQLAIFPQKHFVIVYPLVEQAAGAPGPDENGTSCTGMAGALCITVGPSSTTTADRTRLVFLRTSIALNQT